jgi:ANTAR domain
VAPVCRGRRSSRCWVDALIRALHQRPHPGTLDLYSSKRNAFDANSEVIGELFAAHAEIALTGSARQAEFRRALSHRDTIGIAKGILMHREGISADQAGLRVAKCQH